MTADSAIIYGDKAWSDFIRSIKCSRVIVLTDSSTEKHCLPPFKKSLPSEDILHLNVGPGEASKTIEIAQQLWQRMLNCEVDKDALFINLGGGVVCDLGGYVAANYKRGIRVVNVPTTHLAMTDAALGGKNAINFGGIKNQIGTVHFPLGIWINPKFLESLPQRELYSGWIETVKHALIADQPLWDELRSSEIKKYIFSLETLKTSALIKQRIAMNDPDDRGIRQALNFGHTIGHALEAQSQLLHGEAVAFGIIAESYLSHMLLGLSEDQLMQIVTYFKAYQSAFSGLKIDVTALNESMKNDKKNKNGAIRFSLIEQIGRPKVGVTVEPDLVSEALTFAQGSLGS